MTSPAALSRDPRVKVLGLLRRLGPLTRTELAGYLRVTTTMVGEWIAALVRAGLVEEAGQAESSGGRPPKRLTLAGGAACVLGLDLSGWPIRAVIRDLAGTVRFETALAPEEAAGALSGAAGSGTLQPPGQRSRTPTLPPADADSAVRLTRAVIERAGVPKGQVRAVGLALAGFVDTRAGTHRPAAVSGGDDVPLAHEISLQLGVPVLIEDMARAAALAEARDGAAAGVADLLYLYLGDRVGAALILDGTLYRGSAGIAGEVGHVVVRNEGPRCTCGVPGCLQAVASRHAILREVREALKDGVVSSVAPAPLEADAEAALAAVVEAGARGDRLATSVLRQAGRDVGMALASGVNLLGPTMLVFGGHAPALGDLFLDAARGVLETHVVPPIWERLRLGVGILGAPASVLGAAWSALDLLVDSGLLVGADFSAPHRGRPATQLPREAGSVRPTGPKRRALAAPTP